MKLFKYIHVYLYASTKARLAFVTHLLLFLTLCLSVANFVVCLLSLQTVLTQIRLDKMSGLI